MRKVSKIIIILVCSVLLIGCDNNVSKEEYNKLLSKYEELELKVKDLEALNNKYESLINDYSEIKDEVTTLKSELKNANSSIKELKGYKTKYNELNKKVSNIEEKSGVNNLQNNNMLVHSIIFHKTNSNISYYDKQIIRGLNTMYKTSLGDLIVQVENGYKYSDYFLKFPRPADYFDDNNKTHYVFDDWYTKINCNGEKFIDSTIINLINDLDLYACYKKGNYYNIQYIQIYPDEIYPDDYHKSFSTSKIDEGNSLYSYFDYPYNMSIKGIYLDKELTVLLPRDYKVDKDLKIYIKYEEKVD